MANRPPVDFEAEKNSNPNRTGPDRSACMKMKKPGIPNGIAGFLGKLGEQDYFCPG
jgi:hypothetical protein